MGQPVAVVEKPGARPGIVRYEANRNLTGMGHERFRDGDVVLGERPSAELARRLLATGQVDAVHVYLNMVTVDLKKGHDAAGLKDLVENLYIYYRPGFVPPPLEMPDEPVATAPSGGGDGDGGGGASAAASKVPAHLLERSTAAKAKWFAKQSG
ncbi:MAG TPA: hypothetical protein VF855_04250 [Acidimicrobiales bacterium]